MNALGLTITISLILAILSVSRRWAVLAMIAGVLYLTQGQEIVIVGIHFTSIRVIGLAGFIRVVIWKEISFSVLNTIDKYFLFFTCVYASIYLTHFTLEASLIDDRWNVVGSSIDSILAYFTFRGLLNDPAVYDQFLKDLAFLILPFSIFMIIESVTGKNLFSVMGGLPVTPDIREAHYRCQGSFRHAITAGSLGATLLPLFIYSFISNGKRSASMLGIIACTVIVVTAHSSGPLIGLTAGVIAWLCWPLQRRMQAVRWSIAILVIAFHLIMRAPIWFIFDRISSVIGGDGWHRANLIDQFVNHFKDWWLFGMPLEKTADWAATKMTWGSIDMTNEYVALGLGGGLISLVLFIVLMKKCYEMLGKGMLLVRAYHHNNKTNELLLWGLGCALFSHILNLTAVTYWDQSYVIWYMTLALISCQTSYLLREVSNFNKINYTGPLPQNIYPSLLENERKITA